MSHQHFFSNNFLWGFLERTMYFGRKYTENKNLYPSNLFVFLFFFYFIEYCTVCIIFPLNLISQNNDPKAVSKASPHLQGCWILNFFFFLPKSSPWLWKPSNSHTLTLSPLLHYSDWWRLLWLYADTTFLYMFSLNSCQSIAFVSFLCEYVCIVCA